MTEDEKKPEKKIKDPLTQWEEIRAAIDAQQRTMKELTDAARGIQFAAAKETGKTVVKAWLAFEDEILCGGFSKKYLDLIGALDRLKGLDPNCHRALTDTTDPYGVVQQAGPMRLGYLAKLIDANILTPHMELLPFLGKLAKETGKNTPFQSAPKAPEPKAKK